MSNITKFSTAIVNELKDVSEARMQKKNANKPPSTHDGQQRKFPMIPRLRVDTPFRVTENESRVDMTAKNDAEEPGTLGPVSMVSNTNDPTL